MTTQAGFAHVPGVKDQTAQQALLRLESLIKSQQTALASLTARLTTAEAAIVTLRTRVANTESRLISEAPTSV